MLRSGEISAVTQSKMSGFLRSLHALRLVGMTAQVCSWFEGVGWCFIIWIKAAR